MTRKDYIAIAAAIKGPNPAPAAISETWNLCRDLIADRIADVLARDNSRFDRAKFLTACGV